MRKHAAAYILSASLILCVVIWYAVYGAEAERNLVIHFFDVGQGDGIFFELPNHVQVLIDVLKRYDVGMVIESGVSYATADYDEWNRLLAQKHVHVVYAHAGERVSLSERAVLDILHPFKDMVGARFANVHDSMVVTKLSYGSSTVLFMGDAEKIIEYRLMGSGIAIAADVLKIGYHGSKTSSTEEFLHAVNPRYAVISVGRKNRFGHPHQEVIERIRKFGIKLFRTDEDGDVTFVSDGVLFSELRQ